MPEQQESINTTLETYVSMFARDPHRSRELPVMTVYPFSIAQSSHLGLSEVKLAVYIGDDDPDTIGFALKHAESYLVMFIVQFLGQRLNANASLLAHLLVALMAFDTVVGETPASLANSLIETATEPAFPSELNRSFMSELHRHVLALWFTCKPDSPSNREFLLRRLTLLDHSIGSNEAIERIRTQEPAGMHVAT